MYGGAPNALDILHAQYGGAILFLIPMFGIPPLFAAGLAVCLCYAIPFMVKHIMKSFGQTCSRLGLWLVKRID